MPSRRDFLARSALAGAAVLASAQLPAVSGAPLSRHTFLPMIGEELRFQRANGTAFRMRLANLRDGPTDPRLDQFSLVFDGSDAVATPDTDGLVHLYHPETGPLLMHMEPSTVHERTWVSTFSLLV